MAACSVCYSGVTCHFLILCSCLQVVVPAYLASKLKPHQMAGIRFLWRCLYAEHEVRMTA